MRRIKKAKVKFISLVPAGANRLPVIYKDDGQFDIQMLTKGTAEEGVIVGTVYAPELRDSQGDIASATVIKEMMYDAAKEGVNIDIRHDEKALQKEDAFIAESFIIQKSDPRFDGMKDKDGKVVDVAGGWGVVIKIENPDLREKYKKGEWQGISMGGVAAFEETTKTEEPLTSKSFMSLVKGFFSNLSGDTEMNKEEMTKALDESNKALIEGITKAIAPLLVPKPEEKKAADTTKPADDAPVFTGELTKDNLARFQVEVQKHTIRKAIDWTKPESIQKAMDQIEKLEKAPAKTGFPASNQPAGDAPVEKGDEDLHKSGVELARIVNARRGYDTK